MIPVFGSALGARERREVAEVLRSQWLGRGPKVASFEARFAERLGVPRFLMTDCGTNALFLAVKALDLPEGGEVIVPSFTWVGCATAVRLAGLRPVFCDVDLRTQNVTAATVRPHLSSRTVAILVVHYAGLPVDLEPVLALGLPVIEDAAHAVDSLYRGRPCGTFGEVGVFSFGPVKNLTAGHGGGLVARRPEVFERAQALRYCGIGRSGFEAARERASRWWEQRLVEASLSALPSDVHAAIALAQLERLERLQRRRRALWRRYRARLRELPWVVLPADCERPEDRHSYFTFLVRVPERDRLARFLLERGIYTTLRFPPLHRDPAFGSGERLPASEELGRSGLNLPLHPRLRLRDVDAIVEALAEFGSKEGWNAAEGARARTRRTRGGER